MTKGSPRWRCSRVRHCAGNPIRLHPSGTPNRQSADLGMRPEVPPREALHGIARQDPLKAFTEKASRGAVAQERLSRRRPRSSWPICSATPISTGCQVPSSGICGHRVSWAAGAAEHACQLRRPGFGSEPGKAPLRARSISSQLLRQPCAAVLHEGAHVRVAAGPAHLPNQQATFQVRTRTRAFNMVDQSGPVLSAAETVTVLNDMCVMAPATLIDDRLAWESIEMTGLQLSHSPTVPASCARLSSSTPRGRLTNFWSDDRPDAPAASRWPCDGVHRWWLSPSRRHVPADPRVCGVRRARAPFEYGVFTLRTLRYDVRNVA